VQHWSKGGCGNPIFLSRDPTRQSWAMYFSEIFPGHPPRPPTISRSHSSSAAFKNLTDQPIPKAVVSGISIAPATEARKPRTLGYFFRKSILMKMRNYNGINTKVSTPPPASTSHFRTAYRIANAKCAGNVLTHISKRSGPQCLHRPRQDCGPSQLSDAVRKESLASLSTLSGQANLEGP